MELLQHRRTYGRSLGLDVCSSARQSGVTILILPQSLALQRNQRARIQSGWHFIISESNSLGRRRLDSNSAASLMPHRLSEIKARQPDHLAKQPCEYSTSWTEAKIDERVVQKGVQLAQQRSNITVRVT